MRDQVDARAGEAPRGRAHRVGAAAQRGDAKVEAVRRIDARGFEALVGARDRLRVIELGFAQRAIAGVIGVEPVVLADALDDEALLVARDALAGPEFGARQRRRMQRVMTHDARRREQHLHAARLRCAGRCRGRARVRHWKSSVGRGRDWHSHFDGGADYPRIGVLGDRLARCIRLVYFESWMCRFRCRFARNRLTSVCFSSAIHGGRLLSFACPKESNGGL